MISQIETLKRQIEAIDILMPVFSTNGTGADTPIAPGLGRYAEMSAAKAIVDYLSLQKGIFMTTAEIADGLREEGIKTKSQHFTTIVGGTCATLVEDKKLTMGKKKKNVLLPYQFKKEAGRLVVRPSLTL